MSTYNRINPYIARIKERALLTGSSSTKKTYHISLDLSGGPLPFTVGDSVGILPRNDPILVEEILKTAHFSGEESILDPKTKETSPLRSFLEMKANLSKIPSRLISLLCSRGAPLQKLVEDREQMSSFLTENHVLDLLHQCPKATYSPHELVENLLPLMPRLYSIASSAKVFPDELHLTVSFVSYPLHGKLRHGVASHFLCEQAKIESTSIPIYIQPSNGFTLPSPDASMILIGPGTGVAPFRAFLQERLAKGAKGRNWLFFGERHKATDFYYESFFTDLAQKSFLRLDTAFSRDQKEKIYVQHRLLENSASIWDWLQSGALIYVCGDAEKMAKDVDKALQHIVHKHGALSEEDAYLYLRRLRKEKRYLQDVY